MDYDVLIIGGGMVGASLACALAPTGLSIAVLESTAFDDTAQPSFDERTVALTEGSRRIFTGMGVWGAVAPEATAIRAIHVSDTGSFGMTRLTAADAGTDALGYVVPHRALGRVLMDRIAGADRVQLLCPVRAEAVDARADSVQVRVGDGDALAGRLAVIADGGRSGVREQLAVPVRERSYAVLALVTVVESGLPHRGTAFERFTRHGPLALLPLRECDFAVVWTLPPDDAEDCRALPEGEFLRRLQRAFGDRAGPFRACGARSLYPLSLSQVTTPVRPRAAIIGNAAHTVHPVAGQGFNLGLRDVAALSECIADARAAGEDIGSSAVLRRYARWRGRETDRVAQFTDGLIRLFATESRPLAVLRGIGLAAVDLAPPVKRFLLRRTMGLRSRPARLALGLPPDQPFHG